MRFTASANWSLISGAAAKSLVWRGWARKTSVLNGAVAGYSGWSEITVKVLDLPSITSALELATGQFVSDQFQLTVGDIAYWENNLLNALASEYIEVKIELQLKLGVLSTSDTAIMLCGFADKNTVTETELDDTVQLTVYTAQDVGTRLPSEMISTQYLESNLVGGASGLILGTVPEAFIVDAYLSGSGCKFGAHTITYTAPLYANSASLALDDGDPVYITASNTAYYLTSSVASGSQHVKMYVRDSTLLPMIGAHSEGFIVVAETALLPRNNFTWQSLRRSLVRCYGALGIDTVSIPVHELSSSLGNNKLSIVDVPPDNSDWGKPKQTVCSDGTYLYVGVGNVVYKRDMTSEAYSTVLALTSGSLIYGLQYNGRTRDMWVLSSNVSGSRAQVYNTASTSASAALSVGINAASSVVVSLQNDDATYHDSLLYTDSAYGISELTVDWGTGLITSATCVSQATLGYSGSYGAVQGGMFFASASAKHYECTVHHPSYPYVLCDVAYDTSTKVWAWTMLVDLYAPSNVIDAYAYIPSENRLYWVDPDTTALRCKLVTNTITTPTTLASGIYCNTMLYNGSKVYTTLQNATTLLSAMYEMSAGSASVIDTDTTSVYARAMCWHNSRVYGLDALGRLFNYSKIVSLAVPSIAAERSTVTDVLNSLLQGFNLIGTINSNKTAIVYPRSDLSGTPVNSGYGFSIDAAGASKLIAKRQAYAPAAVVNVSNGARSVYYNGSAFGSDTLSDQIIVTVGNDLIPDYAVVDLAYYMYQYFKTPRMLYTVEIGCTPWFQYEPFDFCTLGFSTTKIVKSGTGVIYSTRCAKDGTFTVTVLI